MMRIGVVSRTLFFCFWATACRDRSHSSPHGTQVSSGSTCTPTRFAAVPAEGGQRIMATIGGTTYRLECLNTTGTNATIYKIRGEPSPEYVYKISHPTEAAEQNYELELDLFTKLQNTAIQPFLLEASPVTYTIRCRTFRGFKKRFVQGPTLRDLGPLNPNDSEHQLVARQLQLLYQALKKVVESGHLISDIHDDNIMWDTAQKKLVIIDGHYDPEARTNFSQYFREQCKNAWPWCSRVTGNPSGRPMPKAM